MKKSTSEILIDGVLYVNVCLVIALVNAMGHLGVTPSEKHVDALVRALRPHGGSAYLTPTNDASTDVNDPALDDDVLAFLLSYGVTVLEVYVRGKFYKAFPVDTESRIERTVAIDLLNYAHWVARRGPSARSASLVHTLEQIEQELLDRALKQIRHDEQRDALLEAQKVYENEMAALALVGMP